MNTALSEATDPIPELQVGDVVDLSIPRSEQVVCERYGVDNPTSGEIVRVSFTGSENKQQEPRAKKVIVQMTNGGLVTLTSRYPYQSWREPLGRGVRIRCNEGRQITRINRRVVVEGVEREVTIWQR